MTKMRIADITVGDRRREDMGDIAVLATSIQKYGLIHAIRVTPHQFRFSRVAIDRVLAGESLLADEAAD